LSGAGDILSALRRETASLHARLDGALDFSPARLDRARYGRFLHATAELVGPLEEALAAAPGFAERLPDRARRVKRPLLDQDLVALGASEPVIPAPVPPLADAAEAFGAAYVLEGSMLGGAVLAKSLGPSLALSREQGLAYLTAYGPELSAMWRGFVAALSAFGAELDDTAHARLVSSACAVFEAFYAHYAHKGVLATHG
jgi:heme oxygenase (biliverdin-IX-beta and delta-forming)